MTEAIALRPAEPSDDTLIALHFRRMWEDNGFNDVEPDWEARILAFLAQARAAQGYHAFVAEVGGVAVGSAGGQLHGGLYPQILNDSTRRHAYVWGVWVDSAWRGQGLGRTLTETVIAHFRAAGCTRILLHASPFGRPLYEALGFAPTNEMRLDLKPCPI